MTKVANYFTKLWCDACVICLACPFVSWHNHKFVRVATSASVGATVSWEGLLCVCDRPAFDDLSHNSSLEAVGFVSLFLPSTLHIDGDVDTPLLTRYCEF